MGRSEERWEEVEVERKSVKGWERVVEQADHTHNERGQTTPTMKEESGPLEDLLLLWLSRTNTFHPVPEINNLPRNDPAFPC